MTLVKLENNRHDCLSCRTVFILPGALDKHLWSDKSCKALYSIQYGLMKDEIAKEKEKHKIDMYIKDLNLFYSLMSSLHDLTATVLENCLKIKYFPLFNAYNIYELEDSGTEKKHYKNQMNDLKTIFFSNFDNLENHKLKLKSSISLVNPTCFKKGCYVFYRIKQSCVLINLGFDNLI